MGLGHEGGGGEEIFIVSERGSPASGVSSDQRWSHIPCSLCSPWATYDLAQLWKGISYLTFADVGLGLYDTWGRVACGT